MDTSCIAAILGFIGQLLVLEAFLDHITAGLDPTRGHKHRPLDVFVLNLCDVFAELGLV